MQRLDMMQHLALQAKAQADGQGPSGLAARGVSRRRAQVIVLAWFSLGVMTSGTMGVGAVLGLRAVEARGTPLTWAGLRTTLGATWTAAWAQMPAIPFRQKPPEQTDGAWNRVEVAIDRSARADAALGLRVTGADSQPVYFVLDGVPKGVRLSHGALVGPATWVLGRDDIDGLHLTLDDTAPTTFDLRIALLAPTGVAKTGSVVEVRLVDGAAPMQAAVNSPGQPRAEEPAAPPAAPLGTVSGALAAAPPPPAAVPAIRGEDKPAKPAPQTQAPADGPRVWPEGAYGLGVVSREKDQKGGWNTPPPAWSPFQSGGQ